MEQFSHDLTLALEETSRCGSGSSRWGMRRRTRSTGNLPCPPQPTEDSSSSPTDPPNDNNNNEHFQGAAGTSNMQSDSDDRHSFAFAFKMRQAPNFESDSLNENFSPSRPNIRRKRKFKRMAVEYETTPSTPHTATTPIFPISGTVKKRVLKHCQENFRANLFFGKRKRRERYLDEAHKHSSSVPRQRSHFLSQRDGNLSYLEYKSRNRASSMSSGKPMEKILPLNKSIVSKIEKINQESKNKLNFNFSSMSLNPCANKDVVDGGSSQPVLFQALPRQSAVASTFIPRNEPTTSASMLLINKPRTEETEEASNHQKMAQKSGSFESALPTKSEHKKKAKYLVAGHQHQKLNKHSRRRELKLQLQFEEPNCGMDCGNLNDFLSSSSLSSSSDSEPLRTNESDHEGDDELTDWPANEVMINFASKNEFKRANKTRPSKLPQIKQQDDLIQDDDTLMSADDLQVTATFCESNLFLEPQQVLPPSTLNLGFKYSPAHDLAGNKLSNSSRPINILTSGDVSFSHPSYQYNKQIESEMSGETSNNFLSSPSHFSEVREIRAGCRRIRDERPAFSIMTSFNEHLLKFLQDDQERQLKIFDIQEYDKILELAKLYSLNVQSEETCIVLSKTSNTMQAIKVEHNNLTRHFLSDYKRRCVGDTDPETSEMAT